MPKIAIDLTNDELDDLLTALTEWKPDFRHREPDADDLPPEDAALNHWTLSVRAERIGDLYVKLGEFIEPYHYDECPAKDGFGCRCEELRQMKYHKRQKEVELEANRQLFVERHEFLHAAFAKESQMNKAADLVIEEILADYKKLADKLPSLEEAYRNLMGKTWSGSPAPDDPDNVWIDDVTGERRMAFPTDGSVPEGFTEREPDELDHFMREEHDTMTSEDRAKLAEMMLSKRIVVGNKPEDKSAISDLFPELVTPRVIELEDEPDYEEIETELIEAVRDVIRANDDKHTLSGNLRDALAVLQTKLAAYDRAQEGY